MVFWLGLGVKGDSWRENSRRARRGGGLGSETVDVCTGEKFLCSFAFASGMDVQSRNTRRAGVVAYTSRYIYTWGFIRPPRTKFSALSNKLK